jgi:SAM-dependent methyltransferase
MLQLGGKFGYRLLRLLSRDPARAKHQGCSRASDAGPPSAAEGIAKLEQCLGPAVWEELRGRTVLDFGCGRGAEAVATALRGAERVYGLDIQRDCLAAARDLARREGVEDRCTFLHAADDREAVDEIAGQIDRAWSLDAFEHYADPAATLAEQFRLLSPAGRLLVAFGPPWHNPYGAHLRFFTRVPWVHLWFREETIMQVRGLYRDDGARRFEEVPGGLNRLTVRRFEELARESGFEIERLRAVPLSRRLMRLDERWDRWLTPGGLREFFTSTVVCTLRKPAAAPAASECLVAAAT